MVRDPFQTLGLPARFELDITATERRYRELSRVVHPDKFSAAGAGERRQALARAVDVNEAFRIVKDPIRRAEALLRAKGVEVSEAAQPRASPALLMEFMELREELSALRAAGDAPRREALGAQVEARERAVLAALVEGFARLEGAEGEPRAAQASALVASLGELRYIRRFLDEVRSIDEDAASGGS